MGDDSTTQLVWPQTPRGFRRLAFEVVQGAQVGRRLLIEQPEHIIGRGHEADLRIDDRGVSRAHAKVLSSPQGIVNLVDLGSKNGVAVNGRRVDMAVLRLGDRIMLGPVVELRFDVAESRAGADQRERASEQLRRHLTARQQQIAKLVARGLSNREIAELLDLRVRSVESHLDRIYNRLDINSRSALTRMVVEAGLDSPAAGH